MKGGKHCGCAPPPEFRIPPPPPPPRWIDQVDNCQEAVSECRNINASLPVSENTFLWIFLPISLIITLFIFILFIVWYCRKNDVRIISQDNTSSIAESISMKVYPPNSAETSSSSSPRSIRVRGDPSHRQGVSRRSCPAPHQRPPPIPGPASPCTASGVVSPGFARRPLDGSTASTPLFDKEINYDVPYKHSNL